MKRFLLCIGKYFAVLLAGIFIFTLLLSVVFCIPNSAVRANYEHALSILDLEGRYPNYLYYQKGSMLDSESDRLMIDTLIIEDESLNAFQAAMSMNSYGRYWHGIQLFLRPAMIVLSYVQIRYLNMFLLMILLCVAFALMHRKLGLAHALAFLISLVATFIIIVPASLQYMPVSVISLFAVIAVLLLYGKRPFSAFPMLFFIVGMLISFFDLLTFPLLALGFPAIVYLLCEYSSDPEATFRSEIRKLFFLCLAWGAGYALCWAGKWVLSGLALGVDAIGDAMQAAAVRVDGLGQSTTLLERFSPFRWNFFALVPENKMMVALVCGLLVVFTAVMAVFPRSKRQLLCSAPLLLLAIMPYVWYFVLSNHSEIHFFFTYRIQAITVFALLSFFINGIDGKRIAALVLRMFHKKKAASH